MTFTKIIPEKCDIAVICKSPVPDGFKYLFNKVLRKLRSRLEDVMFVVPDDKTVQELIEKVGVVPVQRTTSTHVRSIPNCILFRGREQTFGDKKKRWGGHAFPDVGPPIPIDSKSAQNLWRACVSERMWEKRS